MHAGREIEEAKNLAGLPDDLLEHIGPFLTPTSQATATRVCRQFYKFFSPYYSPLIQEHHGIPRKYSGKISAIKIEHKLHIENQIRSIPKYDGIMLQSESVASIVREYDFNRGEIVPFIKIENSNTTKTLGIFAYGARHISNIIALPYGYFAFATHLYLASKNKTLLTLSICRIVEKNTLNKIKLDFTGKFASLRALKDGNIAIIAAEGRAKFILKFLELCKPAIHITPEQKSMEESPKLGRVVN